MYTKVCLFPLIFIVFGCASTSKIPEGSNLLLFDSETWKGNLIDRELILLKNNDRQKMLYDLIINILPEKTKQEVIELLGESEYQTDEKSLRYPTGWDRTSYFPNVDAEWLLIKFDENDIYIDFVIFVS